MKKEYSIVPVGVVNKKEQDVHIKIFDEYSKALLGIGEFSHIVVCTWLHLSDESDKREVLQVHPRGDRNNPLRGVFATRSPIRPNPIAISVCELFEIDGNILKLDDIDVFDGTPVIDIKAFIPNREPSFKFRIPFWADENKRRQIAK